MKKYISPEVNFILINKANIIATSIGTLDNDHTISNPSDVAARRRGFVDDDDDDF